MSAAADGAVITAGQKQGIAGFGEVAAGGAMPLAYTSALLVGSFGYSALTGGIAENIVRLTALMILVITKMLFDSRRSPVFCGISTAAALFVSGAAVSAVMGELVYKLGYYLVYSTAAGMSAFAAAYVLSELKMHRTIELKGISGAAFGLAFVLFTSSLCSVEFYGAAPGAVIGTALTLLAAYGWGGEGGAICGILTAAGAYLASQSAGAACLFLPVSGLFAGHISGRRPYILSGIFSGSYVLLMLLSGMTSAIVPGAFTVAAGVLIFLLTAPHFSDRFISRENDENLFDILTCRSSFMTDTITAVRLENEKLKKIFTAGKNQPDEVDKLRRRVCTGCKNEDSCWNKPESWAAKPLSRLCAMEEFAAESFPAELLKCVKKNELAKTAEMLSRERLALKIMEMRTADSRELINNQIAIAAELIGSAVKMPSLRYSEQLTVRVMTSLARRGAEPEKVFAGYNPAGRFIAEIYYKNEQLPEPASRVCDIVADELSKQLEACPPASSGKLQRIRLSQPPMFELEVYGTSACAGEETENGDSSAVFTDGTGRSYVVISDGMGSGRSAAVESRLLVRMFRRLITGGMEHEAAVKLINSFMLANSPEEGFATLDAACIDLDTGRLELLKSGAAATMIRHGGEVIKISSPTFPIGITGTGELFTAVPEFSEGDIAIMFSDGINENEYRFVRELLLSGDDLKKIVREIIRKAGVFSPTLRSDDVTVLGMRLKKNADSYL